MSTVYGPIQMFAAEYFSTALGMPFEVGKTLLQIEYRPRRRFDPTPEKEEVAYTQDEEEVCFRKICGSSQWSDTDVHSWTIQKMLTCTLPTVWPLLPRHSCLLRRLSRMMRAICQIVSYVNHANWAVS